MEGATNFFETSKSETRAISASIEKLATQVSKMEEKLLEEQREEEVPRTTKPPPKEDDGPATRQPDAPPLPAEHAADVAARIRYAPPEPLPGSFSPRSAGWCKDGYWGSSTYKTEIPCAGISLEKKEASSISKKDVDPDWEDESEEDEPEEEVDEENEEANGIAILTWFRDTIREASRENLEKTLKNLPGVFSASVKLDEEDKTLANGVSVNVDMLLDEEFEPILDILLRDERHDEQDIIRNLEIITKFVDDIKTGNRSIEEISDQWDFNSCIDIIKGERKEKEENPGKEDLEEEEVVALMEEVEDTTIKDEKKPDTRPGEKIDLIMVRVPRKKRNKKNSSNIA